MDEMEIQEPERRGPGRPRKDEIRAPIRATPIRTRKRKGGQLNDRFHIDPSEIPDGISYEWKTHTVYGKNDPYYDSLLREQGWEPVDASRHPNLVPDGFRGPIIRDGMMLMERPVELTQEAMAEDRSAAREAVQTKMVQLGHAPEGTLTRDHPQFRNPIKKSYGPIPVE